MSNVLSNWNTWLREKTVLVFFFLLFFRSSSWLSLKFDSIEIAFVFSSSDFESESSASGEEDLDRGEIHVSFESLLADSELWQLASEFLNIGDKSFGCKCSLLTRLLVSENIKISNNYETLNIMISVDALILQVELTCTCNIVRYQIIIEWISRCSKQYYLFRRIKEYLKII